MAKRASGKKATGRRSTAAARGVTGGAQRRARGVTKAAKHTARTSKPAAVSSAKSSAATTPTGAAKGVVTRKSTTRAGTRRPASLGRRLREAAASPKAKAERRADAARLAATAPRRKTPPPGAASTITSAATAVRGMVAGAMAAVSQKMPWAFGSPDALTLLETDHRRLERLLEQGETSGPEAVEKRRKLLATVTSELNLHELIEEKVFYPALQAHPEARDKVLEGYQEHHLADLIVEELHAVAADDAQWRPKFKVLQESIEHHIQEEERGMFITARAVLGSDELLDLGRRMAEMKAAARDAGERSKRNGRAKRPAGQGRRARTARARGKQGGKAGRR